MKAGPPRLGPSSIASTSSLSMRGCMVSITNAPKASSRPPGTNCSKGYPRGERAGFSSGSPTTSCCWMGSVVTLQEVEVIQAIRLLTRFGQVQTDPNVRPEDLKKEVGETDPNIRLNLQQLLGSLAAKTTQDENDAPLLMKAAEHMAIRFAMERYQKGEIKVNAVHQMMEHMSRQ